MAELLPLDRLQPALLDRLQDDAPDQRAEAAERRVLTRNQLREAVLRDLTWLLNAMRPPARDGIAEWPEVENSVLNYGMPCFSGETASSLDITALERAIRDSLTRFEPRIIPGSLRVETEQQESILDWHNVIGVRISALIWAQPVPLELMLRTALDLETGLVEVRDLGSY
ncbi:MAG: type VI secretion system baseplate subunit TssE [Azoarcus sp.]|nr:type VI secretion system baseplate subunit TssE [Azoarcus sp.]PKO60169.1 MAG: type VI secretion system baseplate subunit TssE [Betaproteobacteria bacterium HGW-Betaproteobacteria-19]